jgi:hypothetical protein
LSGITKILSLASVLFIATNAFGQTWIYIGNTKEKKDKYFISSTCISRENFGFHSDLIRIWVKSEIADRVISKRDYKNVVCKSIWDIDCQKNQYRIEKLIVFDGGGRQIEQYDYEKVSFDLGISGTISEKIITHVCSLSR